MIKSRLCKVFLFTLSLLFLLPGCSKDSGTTTVYCLTELRTLYNGEDTDYQVNFVYDGNGNLLQFQKRSDGHITRWEYTYDTRGNLLTASEYQDGSLAYKTAYSYDDADRIISQAQYDSAMELTESRSYAYDQNGNRISIVTTDKNNKPLSCLYYSYDRDGSCLSIQQGISKDTVAEWIYDEDGKLLEERTAANDGLDCVYTYNDKGWLLSQQIGNGHTGNLVYTHDRYGNIITETSCKNFEDSYLRRTFAYDDQGRLIESVLLNDNGETAHTNTWSYDRQGNIQTRTSAFGSTYLIAEWTYDQEGRILAIKCTDKYSHSEELYTQEVNRTYDEYGNLICSAASWGSETHYTYTAFTLPTALAEKVQAQQAELLDDLIDPLPATPVTEPVVCYVLDNRLPKPDELFPYMGESLLD